MQYAPTFLKISTPCSSKSENEIGSSRGVLHPPLLEPISFSGCIQFDVYFPTQKKESLLTPFCVGIPPDSYRDRMALKSATIAWDPPASLAFKKSIDGGMRYRAVLYTS